MAGRLELMPTSRPHGYPGNGFCWLPIKLARTATSLHLVSNDAQPSVFIDSSEVKQYFTAL